MFDISKYDPTELSYIVDPKTEEEMIAIARAIKVIKTQREELKRLRELARADAEGRLVVLPCKVGDNVYFLLQEFDGEWYMSSPIRITEIGTRGFWTSAFPFEKPNAMDDFTSWSEFGKTVFLSREEAEKALEVRE